MAYAESGSMAAGMNHTGTINRKHIVCFLIIWVVQMAAAFYFCTQKQGFHEDEYYTYYSTARTAGFYVEDGAWMNRETYRSEFVVLPGERFQYGLVKQVQSWDVHPPMYYWVFHTVASLVPNVFSKWIGLSVNLFFHGINIVLLTYLSYLVSGRDVRLAFLVTLVYGLSPAAMSGVVFIRMYEMLTTFVLLCAVLHMRTVQRGERKLSVVRNLVPMAAVTYVGFLTQYYYFIFLFFLAVSFCVWLLWRDRNLWNCLRYGISQAIAFGLAYLTYPSFPAQMFRGQRGAQATENFFDLSNTLDRIRFFLDLLNRYAFGHLFFLLLLLVIVLLAVTVRWQSRRSAVTAAQEERGRTVAEKMQYYMLLFTAAGYFLAVSKTALLLGETSNRYQLPVYGIVVFLTFLAVKILWGRAMRVPAMRGGEIFAFVNKYRKVAEAVAMLFCFAVIIMGYLREDVVFLYPEDREQTVYAGQRAAENTPVVYLYQPGEEWCIWDVTNELLEYPEVYFTAVNHAEGMADDKIRNADSLVMYLPKSKGAQDWLAELGRSDAAWENAACELVFEEKYCDVYYIEK